MPMQTPNETTMTPTVTLARTASERAAAHQLVCRRYAEEFHVDLDALTRATERHFRADVLLIRDGPRLVGTASLMYPGPGPLFPSEHIFGARVREQLHEPALWKAVEVGRVANEAGSPVLRELMLGVLDYLEAYGRSGWVATVRPGMRRCLQKTGLAMHPLRRPADAPALANETHLLDGYKGGEVHSFWASLDATRQAFGKMREGQTPGYFHGTPKNGG